jgi:hypothetical protein
MKPVERVSRSTSLLLFKVCVSPTRNSPLFLSPLILLSFPMFHFYSCVICILSVHIRGSSLPSSVIPYCDFCSIRFFSCLSPYNNSLSILRIYNLSCIASTTFSSSLLHRRTSASSAVCGQFPEHNKKAGNPSDRTSIRLFPEQNEQNPDRFRIAGIN